MFDDRASYAELDHADRLIRTAEFLAEQGLHRAASDVLMLVTRNDAELMPVQRVRLSDVALRVVAALRGQHQASTPSPRRLPLVWEEEAELPVC